MGLCKDQLVGKLTDLFHGVPADEVDDAVARAKSQVAQKTKKAKREKLTELFDSQLQTLKDRGCPEQIVAMLYNQRGEVISKASEMTFADGHVPFLPVIPRTYRSIYDQMPMVRNGNKVGYTYLEPAEITDVVTTPGKPYFIFDIEDGEAMRGKAPKDAEKLIKEQRRRGLTEVEGIALAIHTDVLTRHYVDCVGSRYGSGEVPSLYLIDGQPELGWSSLDDGYSYWGAASCGSD